MQPTPPSAPSPEPQGLIDAFGRRLHYLRLSLTDRCNLRCVYCMPPGGVEKLDHSHVLSLEEQARIVRVAVSLGVDKVRLTGGEPLLRRDLQVLLGEIGRPTPRPDLRLTTNGILLAAKLPMLLEHGVSTVNVSLDTLDPERYGQITGRPGAEGRRFFAAVQEGLAAALAAPGLAVKLNVVALAGVNDDQLLDFARLTLDQPLAVRFIEYMPVGRRQPYRLERFITADQILARLAELGELAPIAPERGDGPARRYRLAGAKGEVGVISAVSSHFCATCNRIRVSAQGHLVPCLLSDAAVDLKATMQAGCDDRELAAAIQRGALMKPAKHGQSPQEICAAGSPMHHLGG